MSGTGLLNRSNVFTAGSMVIATAVGIFSGSLGGIAGFAVMGSFAVVVVTVLVRNPLKYQKQNVRAHLRASLLRPSRAVSGASRLLPADVRGDYHEEWAAWMLDLRADGTPRLRRWIELLTIVLIAAPRLAIALRVAARRAVDR